MKIEPYYWSILFLYSEYAHCNEEESGIRQRKLLLKMTENAFHISQDLLPVGPICFQHLLHSLRQVNIEETQTAPKLLPEYIWECLIVPSELSHQCSGYSHTLTGPKRQVQVFFL